MQGRGTGQRAESPRVAQPNIVYHSQGRRVAMTVRGSRSVEVRRKGRGRHGRAVAVSGRRAASAWREPRCKPSQGGQLGETRRFRGRQIQTLRAALDRARRAAI